MTHPNQPANGAMMELTDEQIIERCKAAGIKWVPPELPDDCDYEIGFPGSFDMVSMDEMRALLSASNPAETQGWKMVPVEPTKEMLAQFGILNERGTARGSYQAMLAASPHYKSLAEKSAVVLDDERAKEAPVLASILHGMVEGSGDTDPAVIYADDYEAIDGDVYVRRAAELLDEFARAASPQAVPAQTRALTDSERELIESAAQCITETVRYETDSFDSPPQPATEWDYNADQLAYALRALLAAQASGGGYE